MKRQHMKRVLRTIANPVKRDLFTELEYTEEELKLMKYLYIDRIKNEYWISDELGISLPTLVNWHNNCIEQMITFYNYQKYKKENNEQNCFDKYFYAA